MLPILYADHLHTLTHKSAYYMLHYQFAPMSKAAMMSPVAVTIEAMF